ncbi:GroES-like protein [Trichoderma evansii]
MPLRCVATKIGSPLQVVKIQAPTPQTGEVLVRLKAVALNHIDWKQVETGHNVSSWPAVIGNDGAGIVEDVGPGVNRFKKGDEVFARFYPSSPSGAAFQELATTSTSDVAFKPASLSYQEASSLSLGFMTAASALYCVLNISLPFVEPALKDANTLKSILVVGGSSAVGAAAVQLLRIALPDAIIITTSSPKHHEHLKSLGATIALDYNAPDITSRIKQASLDGVEAILDTVNGVATDPGLLQTLTGLKLFAELVTGIFAKDIPEAVKHTLVFGKQIMSTPVADELFRALEGMIKSGQYKLPLPVKVIGHGLGDIEQGLEKLKAGVSGTKLVISL